MRTMTLVLTFLSSLSFPLAASPVKAQGSKFRLACEDPKAKSETIVTLEALAKISDLRWQGQASCAELDKALQKMVVIDLRKENIQDLTPVFTLTHVSQLLAGSNRIESLEGIENMTKLVHLDLGDNLIKDIKPLLSLENLIQLRLARNSIKDLGDPSALKNLQKLSLAANGLTSIKSLAPLTKLTYLTVSSNDLDDVSVLDRMPDLKLLNIAFNKICVPATVKKLEARVANVIGGSAQSCSTAATR